jgi:hypothetical protein
MSEGDHYSDGPGWEGEASEPVLGAVARTPLEEKAQNHRHGPGP